MSEIFHLNLHREFSLPLPISKSASIIASSHATGASGWKNENTTRSYSATAMQKMRRKRKCSWNFAGCVATVKGATLTMPFASATF